MTANCLQVFKDQTAGLIAKYPQFQSKTGNLPIQASCPFYMVTSSSMNRQQNDEKKVHLELCISGSWVLQRDKATKIIISSFKCGYDKCFQMLVRYEGSNKQQKKLRGLRFMFEETPKSTLEFFIKQKNSSQLQYFTKILQTKTIFRTGFFQHYKPIKRLGCGTTSIVYSVEDKSDNHIYAVKSSKKAINSGENNGQQKKIFINQISIWNSLDHKNIAKLYSTYQSENSIYMVTELLPYSLLNFIKKYGFPKRSVSTRIIRQLFSAVSYLHQRGIMHRDIKLQNIMLRKDEFLTPVLVDFGIACQIGKNSSDLVRCGTPSYTAPQILSLHPHQTQIKYNQKCDVFSLGIVAFILLVKKSPFEGQTLMQVLQKNKACQISFEDIRRNYKLGQTQIDFLDRVLKKDPADRISSKQALSHPYLQLVPNITNESSKQ